MKNIKMTLWLLTNYGILFQSSIDKLAQLARDAEYTDCISAEGFYKSSSLQMINSAGVTYNGL